MEDMSKDDMKSLDVFHVLEHMENENQGGN